MNIKTTSELLHELKESNHIHDFIHNNQKDLTTPLLHKHLEKLLYEKQLTKAYLANNAGLDRHYVYHILSGLKTPSRNKILAIALTLKLTFEETQYLLKYAHTKELYVRDQWDGLIIYALNKHYSVIKTNQLLDELGEELLK